MEVVYTSDFPAATNGWLADNIPKHKPEHRPCRLYIPYGRSAEPIWADWRRSLPPILRETTLIQLDDVQGMFAEGFKKALPESLSVLAPHKFYEAELAILGMGTRDGHVAFHGRGIPKTFLWGPVRLTKDMAEPLGLEAGTEGWSVGLGALLRAKALLLLLPGPEKWATFKRATEGDDTLPVYHLIKDHEDLTVLTDQ